MIAAFLALTALLEASDCDAPRGVERLWASESTRLVMVGEVHGTVEVPTAFAQTVCAASASRPVVVGLEYEDSAQPAIDAWMSSEGSADDLTLLLQSTAFTRRFDDGRSSGAMLALFNELLALKRSGRSISVVAFVPSVERAQGFSQAYGELEMAQRLSRMVQGHPTSLALVLVGRFHASKSAFGALLPAAAHLPADEVVSLQLNIQGGQMWTCSGQGPEPECGPRDTGGEDDGERGVVLIEDADGRFDGLLSLGPLSASPPARHDQP